jgi:glycosyltransferase involved in cell wall biosynthesis
MTELASHLERAGAEVHYVAEQSLSADRRLMGWETHELCQVKVHFIRSSKDVQNLLTHLPKTAVHITQGVRSNGLIGCAQKRVVAEGLRHYPIMEKVDLRGVNGFIKPLIYALRFHVLAGKIEGFLAIGEGATAWIEKHSLGRVRAIPFAYFLGARRERPMCRADGAFRFVFVGNLITRKGVDLLIRALSELDNQLFELEIVGNGPERAKLEALAEAILPGRVNFVGVQTMRAAIMRVATADCLVLPSTHDGWGAVVSEAQIQGTPVVCSSECGAWGVVRASGVGDVFQSGEVSSLRKCLAAQIERGPVTSEDRETLCRWSHALTAEAGARYLLEILGCRGNFDAQISPPWLPPHTGETVLL